MSNYTQTTDFSAKDQLASGNPSKIIYGSDIDSEFSAIASAITSKSNKVSSPTNNNVAKLDSNGDLVDSGYRFSGTSGDVTYNLTSLNGVTFDITTLNGKSLASSDDVIDNFPSGTKMLFQQTTAPTGWTKETTHNNKGLRVVTGTAGSGGSASWTTTFNGSRTTDGHTLTISEIPSHDHEYSQAATSVSGGPTLTHSQCGSNGNYGSTNGNFIGSTGGGGSHSHGLSLDLEYVDVIIASKD